MACPYESSAQRYLTGGLDQADRTHFEAHLPRCAACARTVAASLRGAPEGTRPASENDPPPAPGTFARGTTVGRYIILSLLGRGGMGEVYSAYDPRLDRKVALKLLREAPGGGATARSAQERLLREAQSTARLAHRNVVIVYDAGTIQDQSGAARVYLAMELVDGQTLAAWLAERRRSWREIREVFLAAAEGLQAAHAAGLVHRDFKPQNVMVGRDGTVRVMDFGLAGDGSEGGAGEGPTIDLTSGEVPTTQTIALTHTGVLLGTPLYMAPEQFLGRKTDARTDQFSFCVALYEALYGERPFADGSLAELVAAVTAARIRQMPKRATVPAFLRRTLLRGLKADPASRFASMRDLIGALRADPFRYRWGVAPGAALSVTLLAAVVGAQRVATRSQRMCRGAAERLQEIWELDERSPRRTTLHQAFITSSSPIAEDTWTRVSKLLDDYLRRWTAAYRDTCEATHVRGDQSAEVLDLRMTCLEGERTALRAVTDIFSRADARVVVEGVNAVNALLPVERCADVAQLRSVVARPADPIVRTRVAELETDWAETKALVDTSQWPAAQGRIAKLVRAARDTGYEPLLGETLALKGWTECETREYTGCGVSYGEVVRIALAGNQDDLAAEASVGMIAATLHRPDGSDENRYWESLASALVRRLGPGHERITAWLEQNKAVASVRWGDFDDAAARLSLALALKRSVLPPTHPDIARTLSDIGYLRAQMGDGNGALAAAQEGLEILVRAYGDRSPDLWNALNNRGVAFSVLHRYKEAESDLRSSIALVTSLVGPNQWSVSDPLTDLGEILLNERRYREAKPLLVSAVRIREQADPMSPDLAEARFALARTQWALGEDRPGARVLAMTALNAYRAVPGYKKWADEVQAWFSSSPAPRDQNRQ